MDWQEYTRDIPLLVLSDLAEAPTIGACEVYGFCLENMFFYYEAGVLRWFYDLNELRKNGSRVASNDETTSFFFEESLKRAAALEKAGWEVSRVNPKTLSDSELSKEFKRFRLSWRAFWDAAMPIDWLEIYLSEAILAELKEAFGADEASALYVSLTFSETPSLPEEEENALLGIVSKIQASSAERKALENNDFAQFISSRPELRSVFEGHCRKFFWVHAPWFPYSVLAPKDFFDRAAEISRRFDASAEIRKKKEKREAALQNKKSALERVKQFPKLTRLIEVNERLSRFHRVKNTVKTLPWFYAKPVIEEIGRRTRLGENVYWLLPSEIALALAGKDYSAVASERARFCLFEFNARGREFKESVGLKAQQDVEKRLQAVAREKTWSEISGVCASAGNARGKARVVRDATQIREIERNEVLIAVMTTPDFTPALKRVAAIVTDEGGVTCHAAVVSRELGVPCVIATRDATKRIKTGELIEVDATNGLVKRIR